MTLFSHSDDYVLTEREIKEMEERSRKAREERRLFLEGLSELTVEERLAKIEERLYDLAQRDRR